MTTTNEHGQPIGDAAPGWSGARPPDFEPMTGPRCRLVPLDLDRHAEALHTAYAEDRSGRNWTYLPYGPFERASDYAALISQVQHRGDTYFFAILDRTDDRPIGVASYLRAAPDMGTIEVGHLCYSPALQRTPISTEAMYLMMRRAFDDWGYRRYEWKCDSLNAPSVAAARRLGFRYEGLFRNHVVMKGRNRDTSWLSITGDEWPGIRSALEAWLAPDNFDAEGRQRRRLAEWMPSSAGEPIVVPAHDVDPGETLPRSASTN